MKTSMLSQLFFPPKCVGCKKRLDIFDEDFNDSRAFCVDCLERWEKEKLDACPTCRVAAVECTCCPDILDKKHIDCISLIKFGRTQSADALIYSLKKQKIAKNFEFASNELAKRFCDYEKSCTKDISDAIFTNVPRKRSTIFTYGFDHARLLAKMTASKVGYPYKELIGRVGRSKDQKMLTGADRKKNVKGKFELSVCGKITERTVVLVDDVITTGSTASECVKVLREGGVKNVVILSLSHAAEKKKAKRKRSKERKNTKKD